MAAHWSFLCVLYSLLVQSAIGIDPFKTITNRIPKLNARIEKLIPCAEFQDSPIQFNDVIINQVGFNQYRLKGEINITEPLDRPLRLELEMYRCRTKGDSSTCEYYFTYKKSGVCDLLQKNNIWDYFTQHTDLPKKCPFPPKLYNINGSSIDLQAMSYLPVYRSFWEIKNKMFQDDKLMFCLLSGVSLEMSINAFNFSSVVN